MESAGEVADEFAAAPRERCRRATRHGASNEANSNPPVGCGLDHVTLANRIANEDANGDGRFARARVLLPIAV